VAQQRRRFAFKSLAARSLVGRVLGGGVGVLAACCGWGIWSLVIQQLVTAFTASFVLLITCDRLPRLRFGLREFRQLAGFGVFTVMTLLLSFSIKRIFTVIAGLLLGVASAGYLNLAFRVVDVFWSISATAVSQVSLPMLAGLQSEPARLKRAYRKSVEYACLFLFPCFVGVSVISPELVTLVFGQKWLPAAPIVAALACLVLAQAPRLFVTPVLTAIGQPGTPLLGLVAEFVFMLTIIALWGLKTPFIATLVWMTCECVQIPISVWLLRRATGYTLLDQFIGARTPLLAAAALAAAVMMSRAMLPVDLSQDYRLVALILIGAVTYIVVLWLLDRRMLSTFLVFAQSAFHRREPIN